MRNSVLLSCLLILPGCSSDGLVTKEEHQAIKSGMNLKQVEGIVGFKGELIKKNQMAAMPATQGVVWNSSDGSRLIVFFVEDKVLFSRHFSSQELSPDNKTPLPLFK